MCIYIGSVYDDASCTAPDLAFSKMQTKWDLKQPFNFSSCNEKGETSFDIDFKYHLANKKAISDPVLINSTAGEYI